MNSTRESKQKLNRIKSISYWDFFAILVLVGCLPLVFLQELNMRTEWKFIPRFSVSFRCFQLNIFLFTWCTRREFGEYKKGHILGAENVYSILINLSCLCGFSFSLPDTPREGSSFKRMFSALRPSLHLQWKKLPSGCIFLSLPWQSHGGQNLKRLKFLKIKLNKQGDTKFSNHQGKLISLALTRLWPQRLNIAGDDLCCGSFRRLLNNANTCISRYIVVVSFIEANVITEISSLCDSAT